MRSDRVGAGGPPAGTAVGPWPALPGETSTAPGETTTASGQATAAPGGNNRAGRDPWPALPDDRELWLPAVGVPDDPRLRRLDREQAGG